MNCQRFESVVSDLARDQMMEAEVRERAVEHSHECEVCAERLRNEECLTQGLRSLVAEMSSFEAPASLEPKLLEAFRARQVVAPVKVNHRYRRYWVAAIAAVLLLVFSVMVMRWRAIEFNPVQDQANAGNEPKPTQIQNDTPTPAPIATPGTEEAPKKIVTPKRRRNEFVAQNQGRRSRPNERSERPVANHAEVATEFIPVGYMGVANLQEGGQIIRVEVPRSRLVSFGVPVNMERSQEKIKADVLVGVDGLARAIRFVQVVDRN